MPESIQYFFSTVSPFAWLGHRTLLAIAARHKVDISFRPFSIGQVWEKSGSVPLGQRSAIRQRYRLVELQRIALMRGLEINPKPAFFPANPERADLCCAAIVLAGGSPAAFAFAAGEAVWARELNLADESVLARLLGETGHDGAKVLDASRAPEAAQLRERNSAEAASLDAIGAPAYAWRGEIFWGQDRLEMLDDMIASGRAPFGAGQV